MPRSSREKSLETRAKIIDAAYSLFIDRGYSASSMREISERAGITVGAIYNHFATKEAIWQEVILAKHPYHDILPVILAADGDSIADVIRAAARKLIHELLKRPDLFNLMFIEIVEFRGRHIPVLVNTILPEVIPIGTILKTKQGKMRDIPIPILMRSFIGFFFSYYITGILMKDQPGMGMDEENLDRFVDLYLYGLLAEEK